MSYTLEVFKSSADLSAKVASFVAALAEESIKSRGSFTVALSGGSLPQLLAADLVESPYKESVDWSKWFVYYADERVVPLDHPDSNHLLAQEKFYQYVGIPSSQIFPAQTTLPTAEVAKAYEETLKSSPNLWVSGSSLPTFDLILLGMGPDGHTASLFPNHPLCNETSRLVAPIFDSPKPPPERITLTLPVLNNARAVGFLSTGAGKAEVLEKVLEADVPPISVPSKLIHPTSGSLYWFIDEPAAALLKKR